MNKNNLLFCAGGLIIGLIVGFIAANNLNRSSSLGQNSGLNQMNPPVQDQQVDSRVVKEQNPKGGMMPEIAATLEKAKSNPNDFEAQVQAGDLYLKIQNFAKALEFYEAANKIKPADYELLVKLGNTSFDAGQFEKAETWYSRALEKKPEDVNVRTDLGITFVERANPDLDRAIREFQTSLQTDPKHEPTLYNLAVAYFKKGNSAEAKNAVEKLAEVNPQSELLLKLKQIIQ